jgi:hypothetical protein
MISEYLERKKEINEKLENLDLGANVILKALIVYNSNNQI